MSRLENYFMDQFLKSGVGAVSPNVGKKLGACPAA